MRSKASRKRLGRHRSVRPLRRSTKSSRKIKSATRRRSMQRGSGIFDSIFSSKWLNWLDKKKDPEQEKKGLSDLADNKQSEMDKLDAELASLRNKYPEIQDVKPSKMPSLGEGIPGSGEPPSYESLFPPNATTGGRGRPRKHRNRRPSYRSRTSRHRGRT